MIFGDPVRVRYHRGDVARIEVPQEFIMRIVELSNDESLVGQFKTLGFKFVSLDLEGFRSGSLNQLISIDSLSTPASPNASGG